MVGVLLLNPEVYNHVYDKTTLVPLLCQKNLVHPLPFYYVNSNHISTSWSSKWSFSLAFPYNALVCLYVYVSRCCCCLKLWKIGKCNKSLRL